MRMVHSAPQRPALSSALPWFLIRNAVLLASGALCLLWLAQSGHAGGWIGEAFIIAAATIHALRCAPRRSARRADLRGPRARW